MQNERNDRRYHVLESSYGSFHRAFQLPDVADARGIEAKFENGILHVSVPKNEEKTKRHQIEVRGGNAGSQASGQMSERMGQQATGEPVESGSGQTGNAADASQGQNQASGQQTQSSQQPAAAQGGSGVGS